MFLKILILSVVLISISMLGMALNVLIKKKGKFPAYQVGHNRDMHKLGISCVKHDEKKSHWKRRKKDNCESCQQLSC